MEYSGSDLRKGLDTFVDERVSGHLVTLYNTHQKYHDLRCKAEEQKKQLRTGTNETTQRQIDELLQSVTLLTDVETSTYSRMD